MTIEQRLKIVLITYNRSYFLNRTLKQLFSDESPVKKCDITVLDNNSTDNTAEIVSGYQKKFPNLIYQKNPFNIGGNANIVRAFEIGASSEKEYVWVLCDDDYYDWSNFDVVTEAMKDNVDCIGVARYAIPDNELNNPAYQFFQLTFVPGGIYKTSVISDAVLTNMYDTIYTMFSQSCISAHILNNSGKISFLEKPIVENGLHVQDPEEPECDYSFYRGAEPSETSFRRKEQLWIFGFANIVRLLNNEKLRSDCMTVSIPYKDIYGTWENFENYMQALPADKQHYLLEVNAVLPNDRKINTCEILNNNEQIEKRKFILEKKAKKLALLQILVILLYKCTHWQIVKKYKNKQNKSRR